MSNFDDRDTAITRDPQAAQQPYQQSYGQPYPPPYYGYEMYGRRGFGRGMGMRGGYGSDWSETKPFFMTSEFLGTLLCILGVCIAAATTSDLNSHGAALFSTILVAAYVVSRGIAKAGTRSRASDPRDDLHLGSADGDR
jgi:hypothetical protein